MFMNVVIRCHSVNYVISYARLTLFVMSFPDLWSGKKEERLGLEGAIGEEVGRGWRQGQRRVGVRAEVGVKIR